ncbi:MAG TPA: prolyl oligopeptidase family serine peptidase [Rhizomicrobium sp.]|nr:prolyl oligopeptidase family serine peptidase [Rhizomicrobium sp.]
MRRWIGVAVVIVVVAAGGWWLKDKFGGGDPYLWLEDVHGDKSLAWVQEQNDKTLKALGTDPDYSKDYDTVLADLDATDRVPVGGLEHEYVFNFWRDKAHPVGIWRRTTIADYANDSPNWETLLDVDKLAADEQADWVYKGRNCSPSLKRCLILLSHGGSDAIVVREFDIASKSFMKDGFILPEAKSYASYVDDDTVIFASDFGAGSRTGSGYPRIVKVWKRGTPIAEAKTVFEGKHEDVTVDPLVFHTKAGNMPVIVEDMSFFDANYYVINSDNTVMKAALPANAVLQGVNNGRLVATLREDWRSAGATKGSLVAIPITADKTVKAEVLYAPGPRASVDEVSVGRDAVYASIYENVVGQVHVFRFDPAKNTWTGSALTLPAAGSVHVASTNDYGPEAQFRYENFLTPLTLYADAGTDKPVAIKSAPARFDASNLTIEQFEATSKDGTKIPYFVTRPKVTKGPAPTVLFGYGGFDMSMTPTYLPNFGQLWLSKGGIYVLANIRGGGEFGPSWHAAAQRENRQKAFDDFQAVAADLEKRGYTTPRQLGILGASNGGLLVSANMVERPDLFGAVVCQVPLTDMVRYAQIGAGASWLDEYGDPGDPQVRSALLQYSPYQNVKADVKYPPVFFITATSDDRVTPVHARKMAAKMEAQGHDVMFYENTDGGHAAAADHRHLAQMWALSFVYLKRKLGLGE